MRLEELRERIKNEVILREGDVADYQWRQMGLTDEASKLELSELDFGRLVNQVSLSVASDSSRITGVKDIILKLAGQRCNKLTEADIRQIVDKAELVNLTRSFVVDMWMPTLLQQIPDVQEPPMPELPPVASVAPPELVRPQPVAPAPPKESASHSVQKTPKPITVMQASPMRDGKTSTAYEASNNFREMSVPGPTINQPLIADSFVKPVKYGGRIIGQISDLIEGYAATRTIRTLLESAKKSISDAEIWHSLLSKGIRWTGLLFETVWKVFVLGGLFTLVVGLGRLLGSREFWRATGAIVRVVIVVAVGWKLWSWYGDWSSKKNSPANNSKVYLTRDRLPEIKTAEICAKVRFLIHAGEGCWPDARCQEYPAQIS